MKSLSFYICSVLFALNLLNIITGTIYFIFPSNLFVWNINGLLIIFTIFLNSLFFALIGKVREKEGTELKRVRILTYIFYLYTNLSVFVLFFINFVGYTPDKVVNAVFSSVILVTFILLFFIPLVILLFFFLDSKKIEENRNKVDVRANKKKILYKFLKILFTIEALFGMIMGLFAIIIFFAPRIQNTLFFFMNVFFIPGALILGIVIYNSTFFLLHTIKKKISEMKFTATSIIVLGLAFSSISFIPMGYIPSTISSIEKEFSNAFNSYFDGDWRKTIEDSGYEDYLLETPFQLTGYFLGTGNPECETISNVLFFDGSESNYLVDKNIKLYFDAYLPKKPTNDLPGKNATIIRIHGGGWVIGDKGMMNVQMMNRYLAAQGYIVFDIQYGLNNNTQVFGSLQSGPEYVYGDFIIDDMLRHIGNFTLYLEKNAAKYGANLSSVFISGGSAGGQLACATALSIVSENYTNIFSDKLTIKGLIPYYPANNVQYEFATRSKEEWVNPSLLINQNSPPCLIFQGEKDRLIEESELIKETYLNYGRKDCALLTFPYGSHAADIYFPGHFNQIFLYYMERFLILYNS